MSSSPLDPSQRATDWLSVLTRAALLIGLALTLSGCTTLNDPIVPGTPEYRFPDEPAGDNTRSLFVCLSFSGGGTRAAAFSYGVLEELRDTTIVWKGQTKRLLDEVDCISSVSGGSFTSAYYGLFGDRIFRDFRGAFLDKDIQLALALRLLNPINWFRLASPYFSRIDLAAEYYDKHLYERGSFASLSASQRPFLLINATDMASGQQFTFTQEQFDFLGSDLSGFPIGRAVAASSAFPFLLSPVTLRNYPNAPGYRLPSEVRAGLENYVDNRRSYYWASGRANYATRKDNLPYVHLMDGGLADNIGLRAFMSEYRRGFIRTAMGRDEIEKLVVIVVNARTLSEDTISESRKAPGLISVAGATATVAMDNYSVETVAVMNDLAEARDQTRRLLEKCKTLPSGCGIEPSLELASGRLVPYVIDLGFEAIPDRKRRKDFLRMGTNFSLPKKEVEALIGVGRELLRESESFQDLMEKIGEP